jgi:hypothetical protein
VSEYGWLLRMLRGDEPPRPRRLVPVPVEWREPLRANPECLERLFVGWEFRATLSFRTPLSVLVHDGEVLPLGAKLPVYGSPWVGAWRPRPKPLTVLRRVTGLTISRGRAPTRRSDVGLMPASGGAFLEYLLSFRRIVEGDANAKVKADQINALRTKPAFTEIAPRIRRTLGEEWMSRRLADSLSVPITVATALFQHGFCDVDAVRSASDARLYAIKGIGPTRIALMRERLGPRVPNGSEAAEERDSPSLPFGRSKKNRKSMALVILPDPNVRKRGAGSRRLLAGMVFRATLQMRTPLHVLEHDGKVMPLDRELPIYGPPWAGKWLPLINPPKGSTTSYREEPALTRRSEIGLVPEDGGAFLQFLKMFRRIIESEFSAEQTLALLNQLRSQAEFARIVRRLPDRWPQAVVYGQLASEIPISSMIAARLFQAGFLDTDSIRAATDEELQRIRGIGPQNLAAIRAALDGRRLRRSRG